MTDLPDDTPDCRPLERVTAIADPIERTDYALRVATAALKREQVLRRTLGAALSRVPEWHGVMRFEFSADELCEPGMVRQRDDGTVTVER